jgi:very-short-patch-repair endonuclease
VVGGVAAGRGSLASRFARTPAMTSRARHLRKDLTEAEKKLWHAIRRDQIGRLNFRRQHPIGVYVLDFYCPSIRLAVEVDGGQHNEAIGRARDDRRARWLASKGVVMLRFWNNEVLSNLEGVLSEIGRAAETRCSARATPSLTLPLSGGGNMKTVH